MRKNTIYIYVIVSQFFMLALAKADGEDAKENKAPSRYFDVSGSAAFVTNYIDRGRTDTFGKPAFQGGLVVSQKKNEGLNVGFWVSNVSNDIAPNGAGLELDIYGGYIYKFKEDVSAGIQLKNTRYPGAYAVLPTEDKYDMLELIPSITYKFISATFYYTLSDYSGVNNNFAPQFNPPLAQRGSSKGSLYSEFVLTIPVIKDSLNAILTYGYQYFNHYTKLNYSYLGAGVAYTLPESFYGIVLSANFSTTNANKSLNTDTNSSGRTINIARSCVWFGVTKTF